MNIFNSLLAQLVKCDVHTTCKINSIHAIFYHILSLSLFNNITALVPLILSTLLIHLYHHHHPRISSRRKSWNKTSGPLHVMHYTTAVMSMLLWPIVCIAIAIYIPLWKSTALSTMPHLISGMNFLKNFANLLMMSPWCCHKHLSLTSSSSSSSPPPLSLCITSFTFTSGPEVLFQDLRRDEIRGWWWSLHLSAIPDSKITFSVNLSHHSLPHLLGRISQIFMTISGLN